MLNEINVAYKLTLREKYRFFVDADWVHTFTKKLLFLSRQCKLFKLGRLFEKGKFVGVVFAFL